MWNQFPFPRTDVYISGKYDILVRRDDGTYLVVDFKLSKPGEEKIQKYQSQLWSYKFAIENPINGADKKKISKMGLVMIYPDEVKFERGRAVLDFPTTWLEILPDEQAFGKLILEVDSLLKGETPLDGKDCTWCKYRGSSVL